MSITFYTFGDCVCRSVRLDNSREFDREMRPASADFFIKFVFAFFAIVKTL